MLTANTLYVQRLTTGLRRWGRQRLQPHLRRVGGVEMSWLAQERRASMKQQSTVIHIVALPTCFRPRPPAVLQSLAIYPPSPLPPAAAPAATNSLWSTGLEKRDEKLDRSCARRRPPVHLRGGDPGGQGPGTRLRQQPAPTCLAIRASHPVPLCPPPSHTLAPLMATLCCPPGHTLAPQATDTAPNDGPDVLKRGNTNIT